MISGMRLLRNRNFSVRDVLGRNTKQSFLIRLRPSTPLFSLCILILAVIAWPNAGLGNNGHCDAWYYWGMSHGSEIVKNNFSWDYYPASRAPLYVVGWLLPESLSPVFWAKLLMLLNTIWPSIFLISGLNRTYWRLALNSYLITSLTPIVFTQSSANYSGVTFNLLCVFGLLLFIGKNNSRTSVILGMISALVILSNVQTLVLAPAFLYLVFLNSIGNRLSSGLRLLGGSIISYSMLVCVLWAGGLSFIESLQFPKVQFTTLLGMVGDVAFFGDLQNPWYLATPLLMFHVWVILLLITPIVKRQDIFPVSLLKVALIQISFLLLGQFVGLSVTFQSGFHAVFAYWLLAPLIYFLYNYSREKENLVFLSTAIFFLFSIFLSQVLQYVIRNLSVESELLVLSIALPTLCIFIFAVIAGLGSPSRVKLTLLILFLIPLLSISTKDYASSFYYDENKPFQYKSSLTNNEYRAATMAVQTFSLSLSKNTAVGALESPENPKLTSLLRASTRSFSSCKFPWSRFESTADLSSSKFETWPNHIIFGSYRFISDSEWKEYFKSDLRINRFQFLIENEKIYWAEIFK
jgi:hypothetical protein